MAMLSIYGHGVYIWPCCLYMAMLSIYGHAVYIWPWGLYMAMLFIYGHEVYIWPCCLYMAMRSIYGHDISLAEGNSCVCSLTFAPSMMIISLLAKPLTIALACVAAYLRSGASLPGLGLGEGSVCW